MSSSVTFRGKSYTIADPNDRDWATGLSGLTAFLTALAAVSTGATGSRPASLAAGQTYFDTSLGIPIWWSGAAWVNSVGASV
jgi:hypothetical protein